VTTTRYSLLDSPIGTLLLVGRPGVLSGLYVADHMGAPRPATGWERDDAALEPVRRQLLEYFAGERTAFDLDLETSGSPWQARVWAGLREIPYGATASYGQLARRLGAPQAARAVGRANGTNPISIVIPCHRVVATTGLGGYGWGLERKAWLLEHERAVAAGGSPLVGLAR